MMACDYDATPTCPTNRTELAKTAVLLHLQEYFACIFTMLAL